MIRLLSRLLLWVCGIVALIYVVICADLFFTQRSIVYLPQPMSMVQGNTVLTLPSSAGPVHVSSRPHDGPNAVIYFGGNGEDVSSVLPRLADAFPDDAVYLLHYPGYGGSAGSPTEKLIIEDALALFDWVHQSHPSVVIIGRSLGTGPAVQVASMRPVSRLVLVTPYDSLVDPAAEKYPFIPVRLLLLDKFDSWRYAPKVTAPTIILAAEHDDIVPRSSTERLRTRFTHTTVDYVVVPGAGHNSISSSPDYWSLLKK